MTLKIEFYESRVQGARRMFRNDEGFEMVQEVFTDLKGTHLNPQTPGTPAYRQAGLNAL